MLRDLVATPGEAAAGRICKRFRYGGDAHAQLYEAVRVEVMKAIMDEREACAAVAEIRFGDVEIRDAILLRESKTPG